MARPQSRERMAPGDASPLSRGLEQMARNAPRREVTAQAVIAGVRRWLAQQNPETCAQALKVGVQWRADNYEPVWFSPQELAVIAAPAPAAGPRGLTFDLPDGSKYHWDTDILKTSQGREKVRQMLPLLMNAQRANPKSAYNDESHPEHAAAVADMNQAYRWLGNEMSPQEETEMATRLTSGVAAEAPTDIAAANQELARIAGSSEGKIVHQRVQTGQPLSPSQQALENRRIELEAVTYAQARKERPAADVPKPLNTYIAKDVMNFVTNQNKTQRIQLAAEHRAKVLGDAGHPHWDEKSTEHKAAVLGMRIATEIMQTGDSTVQIAPDGSIVEE